MKKLIILLISFVFVASASATVYRWVDEKGVLNFADDYSKVPPAYRDKVEEVNIAKMGPSITSQTPSGKKTVSAEPKEMSGDAPPIAQPLVREGDFALRLAEVLKIGQAQNEAEAENMLAAVGVAPRNGWIADYPVTPDIIGELQNAIGEAVDSGRLRMSRDEAVKTFQDLVAQQGLPVKGDKRQYPVAPPQDYEESEAVNNYYYTEGPPIVTYYPPPWDYYYLYGWVPYPFWYSGFFFPGFFILHDFHAHHHHHHHHFISNHFIDPKTHATLRIDPTTRATRTATAHTSGGFASPQARKGATSIFNRSANVKPLSQPGNTGRQGFQNPSAASGKSFGRGFSGPRSFNGGFSRPRSFSGPSIGGQSSFSGYRGGGYSGGFRSGGGGFGGSHGGGHGGGRGGSHR